jgi:hypothetical protein
VVSDSSANTHKRAFIEFSFLLSRSLGDFFNPQKKVNFEYFNEVASFAE